MYCYVIIEYHIKEGIMRFEQSNLQDDYLVNASPQNIDTYNEQREPSIRCR